MKGNRQGKNLTAPSLHIPALLLVFEHLQPGHRSPRAAAGQAGTGSKGRRKIIRPHGRPSCARQGQEGGQKEQWQRKSHPWAARSGQPQHLWAVPLQQAGPRRNEQMAWRKQQAPKPRNVRKNRAAVWGSGLVRENGNWYQMWGFCFRAYCAAKEGLRDLPSQLVWSKAGSGQKYLVNVVLSCTLNALCLENDFSQYRNSCQSLH